MGLQDRQHSITTGNIRHHETTDMSCARTKTDARQTGGRERHVRPLLLYCQAAEEIMDSFFIIVGLGNPGRKYDGSRHNVGFDVIDELVDRHHIGGPERFGKSMIGRGRIGDRRVILVKPMTYMNLSGQAVRPLADYYKIPPEHILVIFDDISLPVGKLRVRPDGSAGGHNGVKSLIAELGCQSFPRIKIGVGEKPHPDYDLADWVLSSFSAQEEKLLEPVVARAVEAAQTVIEEGVQQAMNRFNGM